MRTIPHWLEPIVSRSDRAAAVNELACLFISTAVAKRQAIAAGWPFGAEWPYPAPARLGCESGETVPAKERIVSSLVLDYLAGLFGSREHLIALSATCRSCELAGLAPAAVFEEVASALEPEAASWLRSFLKRDESERAPRAFGLIERTNEDGEVEIHLDL